MEMCVDPGTYRVIVAPLGTEVVTCGARYRLSLGCESCTPPPPPSNDACENATELSVGSFAAGSTLRATADFAPFCGFGPTGVNVWYRVEGNGRQLTASICDAASFDGRLTVYCNGCDELDCVPATVNTCESGSEVTWCSQNRAEYWILLHGRDGDAGDFELSILPGASCSNPIECGGQSGDPCGPASGDCYSAHALGGCNDVVCCRDVCSFDALCCSAGWDDDCVTLAEVFCRP